jgi:hypothetical protein
MAKEKKKKKKGQKGIYIQYVLNTDRQEQLWHVQLTNGSKKWITKHYIVLHHLETPDTQYIIDGFGSKRRNGKNKRIMVPVYWKGFDEPTIMPYEHFKTQYEVYRQER